MFALATGEVLAFLKGSDGTLGVIPISEVKQALDAGYKLITVAELVDAVDADLKLMQNLQKNFSELASACDAQVVRYNGLAATNAMPLEPRNLARACSGGEFVVSTAGEAYDSRSVGEFGRSGGYNRAAR
ncbi:MAG: hypothetical protein WCA98_16655 [Candidatus Acidiferrales bacterium]